VTVADAASAFWVNAASFLVVAVTIAFLRRTGAAPNAPTVKVDGSTSWEHGTMREVIGHVRASPILVDLYILPLLYVLGMASSTLYPAFVRDALHADAGALGTIIGAWGAGTFTTSLVLLPLVVTSKRVGLVSAIALAWFGVVLVALGALGLEPVRDAFNKHAGLDAVTVGAMLAFASGVTGPVVLSQSTGLVQAMAPPPMRGRLSGLSGTLNSGVQPFTNLAIGIAGEAVGTPLAMIGNGAVLCGAVAAFVAFRPSVRASFVGFGTMPPQPSPPPLVPRARGGLGPPP
jgi:hypothetical protein